MPGLRPSRHFAYACGNPECVHSVFHGYEILLGAPDAEICPYCGCRSLRRKGRVPTPSPRPLAGTAGGALLGWAVGGPAGAVIGGLIGLMLGATAEERERRVGPRR